MSAIFEVAERTYAEELKRLDPRRRQAQVVPTPASLPQLDTKKLDKGAASSSIDWSLIRDGIWTFGCPRVGARRRLPETIRRCM